MTNHVRSVFLIRHRCTSYDVAHKLQGQVDIPLDAADEWRIKQTAAALRRLYVDRRQEINHQFIVCPDLKRAHTTVQASTNVLDGIESVDDHRARERSSGDWDGHVVAELAECCPEDFHSWTESRGGELKYGAESKEAVDKRGVKALEDWSTCTGDDTDLFVFSYGVWITQTPQILLGISATDPTLPTVASLRNAYWARLVPMDNPDSTVRWCLLDYNHGPAIADTDEWERER